MKLVLCSIILILSVIIHHTSAELGKCHPPQLDNGVVEAEEGAGGNFFKGEFRCNPGFTLTGPTTLKCRNGIWSGSAPVCSVAGCDPSKLPSLVNGRRLRVKGTRNSVFKYKCNRGYRLFGPKNVYCTKNGWKMEELPVCARFGCDDSSLLGEGIPHGRQRSMFQGAVYRFYCESGAMMEGNSAVYCDGYSWNGTKPECLVPPTPPVLSLELDGVEVSEPLASLGQELKLVCTPQGGNPFPDLAFLLNGERVEPDNKQMTEQGGYNAVYTITVEDTHKNLDMSCIAENRMSSIPVASNHQTLSVRFGPTNTYIQGPEILALETEVTYSCTSDESNPASDITVHVSDQDGNDIDVEVWVDSPKMKGNAGFFSGLSFKFQVLSHYKSVFMSCEAENGVGEASSGHAVHAMYPPTTLQLIGPQYLLSTDDEYEPNNLFTCTTDESNPAATIDWVVEGEDVIENIPEESTATETINQGTGFKKISTLSLPTYDMDRVTVRCISTIEELGFSQSSDNLVLHFLGYPKEVSILGPDSIVLNSVNNFECVKDEDDPDSLVSIHVTSLYGDRVNFDMESDSKILLNIQEHLPGVIVECYAENLAGIGPVKTKEVAILSPPEVEIEGPDQLLPFNMVTYTCLTTSPNNSITWAVTDQDGEAVEFTEFDNSASGLESVLELYADEGIDHIVVSCAATNQAGNAYKEIVAHSAESPKSVEMTGPDKSEAGSMLTYECSSPVSSPQQSIRWEVSDRQYQEIQFQTESPVVENGAVRSQVHISTLPSARMMRVKCVAYNEVGYVEDTSQDYLNYYPDSVTVEGPSSVMSGEEAMFSCASNTAHPAPSLVWSLDGQDVTRDADQANKEEILGDGVPGVSSVSTLKIEPTMGGHKHVLECSVAGSDVHKEVSFDVEEHYEADTYENEDYRDENEEYEEEYDYSETNYDYDDQEYQRETEDDKDNYLSYNYEEPQYQEETETDSDKGNSDYDDQKQIANIDGENYVEYNNHNKEDSHDNLSTNSDQISSENLHTETNEGHKTATDEYEYDYDEEEEDEYEEGDYNSTEDQDAKSYHNTEKQQKVSEEDQYEYDEDNYDYEEDDYSSVQHTKSYDDDSESIEAMDAVENDATEYKKTQLVNEEIFDATQQQQSFAAAETGSAVLSHESDPTTHVSADMFSPKPLYGSGERVLSGAALICVTICSITRLLS